MKRSAIVILIVLLVLGALGAAGYYWVQQVNASKMAVNENDLAAVRRETLIATVSATGTLEPVRQTTLAFLTTGNASQVLVKQGDLVKKGQLLAQLEGRELELQVAQAEASLAAAQAKLDQVKRGPSAEDVAAAQQNLVSAQAAYDRLLQPDPNEVLAAKSDVDRAKAALDQAQAAYDRIGGASNPNIGLMPQALQLQSATLDYQKAQALYISKLTPSNAQIQQALASIRSAQQQLARLQPAVEDIAAAQANVNSAKAARDLAAERLNDVKLVAPFDGTLTRLDLDPGSFVPAGKVVMTLADLSQLRVTVNVDETDIPRVVLGQAVQLDLDAYPEKSFQGKVADIAPGATTVQGVVNYPVKVVVDPGDVNLKLGMTANVNIEVARKEDVLVVPNRAIRAIGNKRMVVAYEGTSAKEVEVHLGLSNDQESEVLSGLNEGDRVFVNAVPAGLPMFGAPGGGR